MKNQQMNEELSPEQLEARREEMKQFYENSLPYLEAQSKYEKLLTDVEEARYKRATMQIQYASMMAAAQGVDLNDDEDEDAYNNNPPPKSVAKVPYESKKLKKG
jgi:ABC-type transport system involved in cytochrome c biogenesis ATPase subunit